MRTRAFLTLALMMNMQLASALVITDVQADTLAPGEEGILLITLVNDLDRDVEEVSLSLDFANLPLTSVGSSEDSVDEIDEDESEVFAFTLRAAATAPPGDYNIPYTITSRDNAVPKKGTIGVKITAPTELVVTAVLDHAVIGKQGKINVKVVNRGQADARFVSIELSPFGYTLLSEEAVYLGTIDSDDFDTASFEVVFTAKRPRISGTLEFRDAEGKNIVQQFTLPAVVYTKEEAVALGIAKRSTLPFVLAIVVFAVLFWVLWRLVRRYQRLQKSMQQR